jgi:hypothetical protein
MVHNPTVGTVQATEFSKLSAQTAPFVYFDPRSSAKRLIMSSFYLRQQRAKRASFILDYVSAANKRGRGRCGRAVRPGRRVLTDWLKMKNPDAPAVKREAEADWFRS